MGADNVLLFVLVWTLTAVCQADDDVCSVSCMNVTGTVGKEVNLTCSVSQKRSECCIIKYKFAYPEKYDSTICRDDLPLDSCEQRNSFTCTYTPTTAMTGQFRFYLQTTCVLKRTEFTVNITEHSKPEIDSEAPSQKEPIKPEIDTEDPGHRSVFTGAVLGCFIIIFIIGISVFCVKRFKRSNPSGLQIEYERGAPEEPTMTAVNDQNETE